MSSDDLSDQPTGSLPHVLKNKQVVSRMEWGRKALLQDEALLALQACLTASTQDSNTASVAVAAAPALCRSSEELCTSWLALTLQAAITALAKGPQQWNSFDEALILSTLRSVSRELLPAMSPMQLPVESSHSQSRVDFALRLLEGASCLSEGESESIESSIGQAVVACVGRLVASCSEEQQRGIAVSACAHITQYQVGSQPPSVQVPSSTSSSYYTAAASCAALSGMRPGVLVGDSIWSVVEVLLSVLSSSPSSEEDATLDPMAVDTAAPLANAPPPSTPQALSPLQASPALALAPILNKSGDGCCCLGLGVNTAAAALALASILNKSGDGEGMEEAVIRIVDQGLLPHVPAHSSCIHALAWCTRALAMRGHKRVSSLATSIMDLLHQLPAGDVAVPPLLNPVASSSSQFFQILLTSNSAGAGGGGGLGYSLDPSMHARCKPLWQQRTFMLCTRSLAELSKDGPAQSPLLLATAYIILTTPLALQLQAGPSSCTSSLMAALCYLTQQVLSLTPSESSAPHTPGVFPDTAQCALVSSRPPSPPTQWLELLHDTLRLLLDYFGNPQLRSGLEECVPQLIPCLCSLAALPASAGVRAAALEGLIAVVDQQLLHLLWQAQLWQHRIDQGEGGQGHAGQGRYQLAAPRLRRPPLLDAPWHSSGSRGPAPHHRYHTSRH
eukprot:gene2569-30953_t